MTVQDYMDLFPGASREKAKFTALAGAVLRQAADLIPLAAALQSGFSLSAAEGVQLDLLAESFGLARADTAAGQDIPDAEFRRYLQAKLALWAWDGTNGMVPEALAAGLPGSTQQDNMDGTVTVAPTGALPAPAKDLFPVPAGIRAAGPA